MTLKRSDNHQTLRSHVLIGLYYLQIVLSHRIEYE